MEDDNNTASKLMNDDIKEIIRKRKQKIELNKSLNVQGYYDKEDKALLDYITNLQQENERLKELCNKYEEEHSTAFNLWKMKMEEMPTYEEKEDYKSRIEKAVEYIKEDMYSEPNELYGLVDGEYLLNILNGKE